MVDRSIAADGGEASYFEAPVLPSKGFVAGSQSPVRYGVVENDVTNNLSGCGFIPGTPETPENKDQR